MKAPLILALLVILGLTQAYAQTPIETQLEQRDNYRLKGLQALQLHVAEVQLNDSTNGDFNVLTSEELKTLVELRLRVNRVRVVKLELPDHATDEQFKAFMDVMKTPKAQLTVYVNVIRNANIYFYSLMVKVTDFAKLDRDPKIVVDGELYSDDAIASGGASDLKSSMRDQITAMLDKLCNKFLRANEK